MTEPEQTVDSPKQGRRPWYVWDIVLLLGFVVGSEKMRIPETQPVTRREYPGGGVYEPGEYRLPFAPGAYVWCEIR